MSILNKDNNGYITPEEFNSFAKQAQLEIFNQYFVDFRNSKLADVKGKQFVVPDCFSLDPEIDFNPIKGANTN